MDYKINSVEMTDEFKVCPICGYEDGFHSMFLRDGKSILMRWLFICPSCHEVFDTGLDAPQPR